MKPWSRHQLLRNTEPTRSRPQTMSRPLIQATTRNLIVIEVTRSQLNKRKQGKPRSRHLLEVAAVSNNALGLSYGHGILTIYEN